MGLESRRRTATTHDTTNQYENRKRAKKKRVKRPAIFKGGLIGLESRRRTATTPGTTNQQEFREKAQKKSESKDPLFLKGD